MELEFEVLNLKDEPKRKDFQTDTQYQIAVSRFRTSVTNSGKSYTVFSKVFSIRIKYIKKYEPYIVQFDAREENRQRLYKKIISNAFKYLQEYELCSENPIDGRELSDEMFYIKKKD
jgi:hypothetical protein